MFDRLIDLGRAAAQAGDLRDRPDADLLRRFARDRNEFAFAALVRRHGPAVWATCGRVLGNRQDTEDAFQATFLLLAQRAGELEEPASVGGWLYGVAVRTAREARAAAARRRAKERTAPPRPTWAPDPARDEALAALDEEVGGLPEPFRAAIVLCDLMGKPRAAAAAELGCAEGTVASRLARGRALLAARLSRRGIGMPAGGVAAVLAADTVAAVPPTLAASTTRLAVLLAADSTAATAIPASVQVLVTGVAIPMSSTGTKIVAAALLCGMATLGGIALAQTGAPPAPPLPMNPPVSTVGVKPKAETPAERFARIKAEYDAELKAQTADGETVLPGGQKVKTTRAGALNPAKYFPALLELGRTADDETAYAALELAVLFPGGERLEGGRSPRHEEALDLLIRRFADGPRLRGLIDKLHQAPMLDKHKAFARMATESKDRPTVARSLLQVALAEDESWSGPREDLPPAERDARRDRAAASYRRIVAEFANLTWARPSDDPVKQAALQLRRLASVRPGLPAVATGGLDADGRPMDLADLKGKVVVLVVRSSGCVAYVGRLPELKALAARYADRGVVFVGIVDGRTEADARRAAEGDKLPWRTWLDVHAGPGLPGPLADAWCTEGSPALIVVDRAGVIRHTQAHEYFLPQVLDKVLAEKPEKSKS